MTDLADHARSVPARLGVSGWLEGEDLVMGLTPTPEVLHHGVVRASVLSFVIDAVAGISIDSDPDAWSLTTDLSIRMRPVPAPPELVARSRVVRQGRRSSTCVVDVTDDGGAPVASGALGFTRLPRREGDPPKPDVTPASAAAMFDGRGRLDAPLLEEAGIEVLDAAGGVVEIEVTPELRNTAGTLQGAMVALVAEVAAEELVAARLGQPVVVTELDLRYLAQATSGRVRTRAQALDDEPDGALRIELVDTTAERLTTLAFARARAVD